MKTPQLPVTALSLELGIPNEVWLKYENKHHYGSHKGRSIPLMIDEYRKNGVNSFVISSSGNAALAALRSVAAHNKNKSRAPLKLKIFAGQNIAGNKLQILKKEIEETKCGAIVTESVKGYDLNDNITLEQVDNPKQSAMKFETENGAKWLRSSTDPIAAAGYQGLAEELAKIENLSAVFIPTSSGTSAQGLAEGFKSLEIHPQLHIIQTTTAHPIVSFLFESQNRKLPDFPKEEKSLAGAIVDIVGLRKSAVGEAVIASGGGGWIATNEDIKNAVALGKKIGVDLSPNSALSLVGLKKAISSGFRWDGPVVLLVTGE